MNTCPRKSEVVAGAAGNHAWKPFDVLPIASLARAYRGSLVADLADRTGWSMMAINSF